MVEGLDSEIVGVVPVAPGLIGGTSRAPRLIASECRRCGVVAFPYQGSCPACTVVDVGERLLLPRGTLWTWTVQCFRPKSPPYVGVDADDFVPYGVGYVELDGEVRVEALLTESDPERLRIGMAMELVLVPAPGREDGRVTYAFEPVTEEGR